MQIKTTRERQQNGENNSTIYSSTLGKNISTEQTDINNEFIEFLASAGNWENIFNDTSSQNFTFDNAVSMPDFSRLHLI